MSIHTVTIDEFMQLTRQEHEQALDLYDKAISEAAQELCGFEVDYDRFANDRDQLGRLLTLRKVHQARLDELKAEAERSAAQEPVAGPLASQQWQQNERQPQLA